MTENGIFQVIFYILSILIFVQPLGWYIARVFENKPCGIDKIIYPIEYFLYRMCGCDPKEEMNWKQYLSSMLIFNLLGCIAFYLILRLQYYFPFNPQDFSGTRPDLSFNTAISFVTNTNWQAYSGEKTLSYFAQMLACTTQNFFSAATGLCILIAFIRGLTRHETTHLGNFWQDLIRGTLYIFLPMACIVAIILASQGVIQNFHAYQTVNLLQPVTIQKEQIIPMGPVASQVAIKQLGSNGGGFFNTNSAHPFENPTPFTNFLEMLAILLIPAALCHTFGIMVNDKRQGFALLLTMFLLFLPFTGIALLAEQKGNPAFTQLGIDQTPQKLSPGGNMEGKEVRFGIVNSAVWTTATTATSNGSVNAMLDSFTPIGGLMAVWLMHLGEVIFGGVGSGLYGMLMLVVITVFIAGLMVGRTPEYLGKKIEPFEMKMASVAALLMPLVVLVLTAIACVTTGGTSSIFNPNEHGFTEMLYAFTSMGNNNGSAFAGLNADTAFYNILGGIEMLILRFWIAIPVLAIAGSLAQKKIIPTSLGTLPTHTLLFIFLLIGVILAIGALTFFPALVLGPITEHFILWGKYGR